LADLIRPFAATARAGIRFATSGSVAVPRTTSSLGDRSFTVAALRAWDSLTSPLGRFDSVNTQTPKNSGQFAHIDWAQVRESPRAASAKDLAELLRRNEPVRTLRSFSSLPLSVPRCNLEFGSRAFRISAPKISNSLPATNIRDSPSLPTFRRHLKTHYFQLAYLSP